MLLQPDDFPAPVEMPPYQASNDDKEKDDLDDLFSDLNPDDGLDI